MSVPNTTYQNSYTADGVNASWAFTWAVINQLLSQVNVYLNGVLQSSGYSVSYNTVGLGGTVTFTSIPTAGTAILILRDTDFLQVNTFGNNQTLPPATLISMFDKLTMMCQQIALGLGIIGGNPTPVLGGVFALNAAGNLVYVPPVQAGYALLDGGPGQPPAYGPAASASGGNIVGPLPATNVAHSIPLWGGTDGRTIKGGVAPNTPGYILTDNGPGADPTFQPAAGVTPPGTNNYETLGGGTSITTTAGNIVQVTGIAAGTYLAIGQMTVLGVTSGDEVTMTVTAGTNATIAKTISSTAGQTTGLQLYQAAVGIVVITAAGGVVNLQAQGSTGTATAQSNQTRLTMIRIA